MTTGRPTTPISLAFMRGGHDPARPAAPRGASPAAPWPRASLIAACGGGSASTGGGRRGERVRAGLHRQDRRAELDVLELAALHRHQEQDRPPLPRPLRQEVQDEDELPGGHRGQRVLLREGAGAAQGQPGHRPRHRHADRLDGRQVGRPRLLRAARPEPPAQRRGQPGRRAQGPLDRPAEQPPGAVAVRLHRPRLQPRADRVRGQERRGPLAPEPEGQGHAADRDARHAGPDHAPASASTPPSAPWTTRRRPATTSRPYVNNGQIRRFTGNDYASDLAKGNVYACMAWSGDIVQLQLDNPKLKFVVPGEGLDALDGQHDDPQERVAPVQRAPVDELLLPARDRGHGRGLRQLRVSRSTGRRTCC